MDNIFDPSIFKLLENETNYIRGILELNQIEFEKIGNLETENIIDKLWQQESVNFTIKRVNIESEFGFEHLVEESNRLLSTLFYWKSMVRESIKNACLKQLIEFKDEFVIRYLHDAEMDYIIGLDAMSKAQINDRIAYALEYNETKSSKKIDGVEIETKRISIYGQQVLGIDVEVGTNGNGYKYNTSRTYFSIKKRSTSPMSLS